MLCRFLKIHVEPKNASISATFPLTLWVTFSVTILLEISVLMCGLFLWGLYDYRRAPKQLTEEQRKKLKPIAKAWDVTPEELQDRVVPKAIMVISGLVVLLCVILRATVLS